MNQLRRLWCRVTAHLLDELIGIHQRVHAAFGHKLGRTHAFPLFQGKRRNRTLIYNAEYDSSGKLQRGVLFITTGAFVQPAASEQWTIGPGWRRWPPTPKHLERLAHRVYRALRDEFNLDLAPLKMPIKLAVWTNELATEFAHRSGFNPEHPQMVKCLRRIFVRGGHATVGGEHYELPHEGLGGDLAAYLLAACRNRVDLHWARLGVPEATPIQVWQKAPQLWVSLTPEATTGAALGFAQPSKDPPGGIQLARYPRPGESNSADAALQAVTQLSAPSLFEVIASLPAPGEPGELAAWTEIVRQIARSGPEGSKIWNLTQPEVLEASREAIKKWDKSFSRWIKEITGPD